MWEYLTTREPIVYLSWTLGFIGGFFVGQGQISLGLFIWGVGLLIILLR